PVGVRALHLHDGLNGVLAAADWSPNAGLSRATDGGQTWTRTTTESAQRFVFKNESLGYALPAIGGTVLLTHGGGITWSRITLPSHNAPASLALTRDGFFAGGDFGVILGAHEIPSQASRGARHP